MIRIITDNAPDDTAKKRPTRTPEQITADEARKEARAGNEARRRDTRRKVVLGAALMALAASGDEDAAKMVTRLKDTLSERDRKLFDDA